MIAAHKEELDDAERIAGDHVARWEAAKPTPCAPALDEFDRRWRALGDGEGLTIEWPSLAIIGAVRFASK